MDYFTKTHNSSKGLNHMEMIPIEDIDLTQTRRLRNLDLNSTIKYETWEPYDSIRHVGMKYSKDGVGNNRVRLFVSNKEIFEDIKKNGIKEPIVLAAGNRLVDGLLRVQIAQQLGITDIPYQHIGG